MRTKRGTKRGTKIGIGAGIIVLWVVAIIVISNITRSNFSKIFEREQEIRALREYIELTTVLKEYVELPEKNSAFIVKIEQLQREIDTLRYELDMKQYKKKQKILKKHDVSYMNKDYETFENWKRAGK